MGVPARISLILGAAMLLALPGCGQAPQARAQPVAGVVETIDAPALAARVADGTVILVDVRSPEEFAEGRITGAVNLPLDRFDPAVLPQEAGKETILYCRSDRRSGIAAQRMIEAGMAEARHLEGGFLAWQESGLPVVE